MLIMRHRFAHPEKISAIKMSMLRK
jgi:hypothetical protein